MATFELERQDISLKRGSSARFNIFLNDPDGNVYILEADEILRFAVKKYPASGKTWIEKTATASDLNAGAYPITFVPEDTLPMEFGTYKYDYGIQSGENFYPCILVSDFNLLENVAEPEEVTDA